ncbi:MAG: hypothetical protein QXP53_00925 [Candidatus Pacearchaeota archaeon]
MENSEQLNFTEKLIKEIEEEQNREIKIEVEKDFFIYHWIDKITPVHSRWRLLMFLPDFFELIKITSKMEEEIENGKANN